MAPSAEPSGSGSLTPDLKPGGSLAPGSSLAIRYSGSSGLLFEGRLTARFDDGDVVPRDASGTIPAGGSITQPLSDEIIAVRVTGAITSAEGTYRVEILGGRLQGVDFEPEQVLAVGETSGGGSTLQVDYGDIDR